MPMERAEKVKTVKKVSKPEVTKFEAYAQGYFDCLSHYGVVSKLQRQRIKQQLTLKGPSYVKRRGGGVPVL